MTILETPMFDIKINDAVENFKGEYDVAEISISELKNLDPDLNSDLSNDKEYRIQDQDNWVSFVPGEKKMLDWLSYKLQVLLTSCKLANKYLNKEYITAPFKLEYQDQIADPEIFVFDNTEYFNTIDNLVTRVVQLVKDDVTTQMTISRGGETD